MTTTAIAAVTTNLRREYPAKFISFLDRTRTGHDCFRRGPVTPHQQQQRTHETESVKEKQGLVPRVYCPKPIQRLPPLPHNHQVKNGSIDRKELATTINFAAVTSPLISFMSFFTGDTDSLQHSMSSAFQITNPLSAGRSPLSKRKCSSMEGSQSLLFSNSYDSGNIRVCTTLRVCVFDFKKLYFRRASQKSIPLSIVLFPVRFPNKYKTLANKHSFPYRRLNSQKTKKPTHFPNKGSEAFTFCFSFNSYSFDKFAEITNKVTKECIRDDDDARPVSNELDDDDDDDDDFEFFLVRCNSDVTV
ncbi:uncharacterized protein LOC114257038 [Camellia sinensis]|uniref:uncharacterized protein LOC114257038 n=1 Tax=Camellia sinensis TaxID=4442 RepID=UPI00103572C0|nr:uncharacterized protein LOC114257038 [Camellia sinensis]